MIRKRASEWVSEGWMRMFVCLVKMDNSDLPFPIYPLTALTHARCRVLRFQWIAPRTWFASFSLFFPVKTLPRCMQTSFLFSEGQIKGVIFSLDLWTRPFSPKGVYPPGPVIIIGDCFPACLLDWLAWPWSQIITRAHSDENFPPGPRLYEHMHKTDGVYYDERSKTMLELANLVGLQVTALPINIMIATHAVTTASPNPVVHLHLHLHIRRVFVSLEDANHFIITKKIILRERMIIFYIQTYGGIFFFVSGIRFNSSSSVKDWGWW